MNAPVQILYWVSTALLVPVVVALLGMLAWSLLAFGGFLREALERRRRGAGREACFAWLGGGAEPPDEAALQAFFDGDGYPGLLSGFAAAGRCLRSRPLELRKLADEIEVQAAARLSRFGLGARVGPMLGLMGTLIPLGPALIGLSSGHIEELASNLVVAFGTTVVGLLAGALFYAMQHTRRHWYARDLSHIEYLCERLGAGAQTTP